MFTVSRVEEKRKVFINRLQKKRKGLKSLQIVILFWWLKEYSTHLNKEFYENESGNSSLPRYRLLNVQHKKNLLKRLSNGIGFNKNLSWQLKTVLFISFSNVMFVNSLQTFVYWHKYIPTVVENLEVTEGEHLPSGS